MRLSLRKRMKTIHFVYLFFAIMILMLLASCGKESITIKQEPTKTANTSFTNSNIVSASGQVVANKYANLSFMVGCQEYILLANPGDQVKDGDILAMISPDALPQSIILAQGDLNGTQRELDNLKISQTEIFEAEQAKIQAEQSVKDAKKDLDNEKNHTASDDYINRLQARIDIAQKEVDDAQKAFDDVDDRPEGDEIKAQAMLRLTNAKLAIKDLRNQMSWYTDASDPLDVDEKDAALSVAEAKLADAERHYDLLKNGTNPDKIAAAESQVQALQSVINYKNIISPLDGTVVEVYGRSGESIASGTPLILIADLSTLEIQTTDLSEVDIARVNVGDPVMITFDALPNLEVKGKVSEIALKNSSGSGVNYTVKITMDVTPKELRWGMSAYVKIDVSKK